MKHICKAAFGITLAISSTALWADDASERAFNNEEKMEQQPSEAMPTSQEPRASYDEGTAAAIARDEQRPQPPEYVYQQPPQRSAYYDPRHPQTGQLIGRGLFNQTGPNDFGA